MTICEHTTADQLIDRYVARRAARAGERGQLFAELWRCASEATLGGKRIRPRLVMRAHELLGGTSADDAAHAAAAFEILHTALLLHDDVLDADLVRRGEPNLAGRFASAALDDGLDAASATRWGTAAAVIAGDVLLSGVHTLLAQIEGPARRELHELMDDCLTATAAGELIDVGSALGVVAPTQDELLRMMEQKTAAYSFAAPLQAGALIAGADQAAVDVLERIGTRLGVLYQLQDDLIGVFGLERRTGKSATGDLREGKRTLLVAFAEGSAQWDAVRHLFGRAPLEAPDADLLREALVSSGAVERLRSTIDAHQREVCAMIDAAPLPAELRTELHSVALACTERDA